MGKSHTLLARALLTSKELLVLRAIDASQPFTHAFLIPIPG